MVILSIFCISGVDTITMSWYVFTQTSESIRKYAWYKNILIESDSIENAKSIYSKFLERHDLRDCSMDSLKIEEQAGYRKIETESMDSIEDDLESL